MPHCGNSGKFHQNVKLKTGILKKEKDSTRKLIQQFNLYMIITLNEARFMEERTSRMIFSSGEVQRRKLVKNYQIKLREMS